MNSQPCREHAEQGRLPHASQSILETIISRSTVPILVGFQACRTEAVIPRLRELVEPFAGKVQAVQVDVTAHLSLIEHFKSRVIPTWLIIRCGVPVEFMVGLVPSRFIVDTLRQAIGVASGIDAGAKRKAERRDHPCFPRLRPIWESIPTKLFVDLASAMSQCCL